MSWKNIMVYLEGGRDDERVLDQATRLAQRQGARITGVITKPAPEPNWAVIGEGAISREAIEQLRTVGTKQADDALALFARALADSGVKGDTRVQECPSHAAAEVVAQFVRRHDLAVMSQSNPASQRFGGQELLD